MTVSVFDQKGCFRSFKTGPAEIAFASLLQHLDEYRHKPQGRCADQAKQNIMANLYFKAVATASDPSGASMSQTTCQLLIFFDIGDKLYGLSKAKTSIELILMTGILGF